MGITHPVDDTVGGCIGFGIETKVEYVRQMILPFQHSHVAVGGLREISAADEHARADHLSILHDEYTHVAGILDAVKGDGTL